MPVAIARIISSSDLRDRERSPPIPPSCKICKICKNPLENKNSKNSRNTVLIHVNNCVVHKACTETCD